MRRSPTMISFALASAFVANLAVLARGAHALPQHSSSSSSSSSMFSMFAVTEAPSATPPQHHDTASGAAASNGIATKSKTVTLPAIPPPTGTKKSTNLNPRNSFSMFTPFFTLTAPVPSSLFRMHRVMHPRARRTAHLNYPIHAQCEHAPDAHSTCLR